jgi:hypothetical protein
MFMDSSQPYSRRRLRVVADASPGAIAHVVERFQNLNIVPRQVIAECTSNNILHIQVDVGGLPEEQLKLIVVKIRQGTSIVSAHWHQLD